MHLVDEARNRIEKTYTRPFSDRLIRKILTLVLPNPGIFRLALFFARLGKPLADLMPERIKALLRLAPTKIKAASKFDHPQVFRPEGKPKMRVALMTGCAQRILRPSINEASIRLLTRHGCEVVIANGAGCCGALAHHMGHENDATTSAQANITAWDNSREKDGELDAIVINTSGCGTMVKDYSFIFRDNPKWAEKADWVSRKAKDITEVLMLLELKAKKNEQDTTIAYHSACSMQHGQSINEEPKTLLEQVGFKVDVPVEAHLCCGSAGTYNITQPKYASQLRNRKISNLRATGAEVIATGNIGCLQQLSGDETGIPGLVVVHTVELLDWATGGPKPEGVA